MSVSSLLLLSCTDSKRLFPVEAIPAIERYTGVFFKAIKKWQREHPGIAGPDLLIISAQFGLVTPQTPIPFYDQRMNAARAAVLAPQVQNDLQKQLINHQYKRILINLGQDYHQVLDGFSGLNGATWASGSIGVRARQLKLWMNETVN